ncbi:MAG: oxidoreductase [Trueperaceae bacterium]
MMRTPGQGDLDALSREIERYLARLPRQGGRVALVTGANGALGAEVARFLALKGASVVMACRNLETGERARQGIQDELSKAKSEPPQLELMHLDLGSLASVRRFAQAFSDGHQRLDLLFANAGIMAVERRLTEDGFEAQFGVNHLGHFALTGRLLPMLLSTPRARVVTTTSSAAYGGRIEFDDLTGERGYRRWTAYSQSKLANILFAFGLQRRLLAAGAGAAASSAHPGLVHTDLQRNAAVATRSSIEGWLLERAVPLLGQSASMGALPLLYAALAPSSNGGELWGPRWSFFRGRPVVQKPPRSALDTSLQDRLWRVSEELTGVDFAGIARNIAG